MIPTTFIIKQHLKENCFPISLANMGRNHACFQSIFLFKKWYFQPALHWSIVTYIRDFSISVPFECELPTVWYFRFCTHESHGIQDQVLTFLCSFIYIIMWQRNETQKYDTDTILFYCLHTSVALISYHFYNAQSKWSSQNPEYMVLKGHN